MLTGKAPRQLHQPYRNHLCYITRTLLKTDANTYALPKSLTDNCIRQSHTFLFGINVTLKFTEVDLHIVNGIGVLSAGIPTIKIWFLYPPTVFLLFRKIALSLWKHGCVMFIVKDKNPSILEDDYSEDNRLTGTGERLERGLIMATGPGPAGIYLPMGTIHAIYTITGGFLCSIT